MMILHKKLKICKYPRDLLDTRRRITFIPLDEIANRMKIVLPHHFTMNILLKRRCFRLSMLIDNDDSFSCVHVYMCFHFIPPKRFLSPSYSHHHHQHLIFGIICESAVNYPPYIEVFSKNSFFYKSITNLLLS